MTIFYIIFLIILSISFTFAQLSDNPPISFTQKDSRRIYNGEHKVNVNVIQFDDIPQGVGATIIQNRDYIVLRTSGHERIIYHKEIVAISLDSASHIANNPNFSVGKALVGTAVFGGVGAIAGVSGKSSLKMLVITYTQNNKIERMMFLAKKKDIQDIYKDMSLSIK